MSKNNPKKNHDDNPTIKVAADQQIGILGGSKSPSSADSEEEDTSAVFSSQRSSTSSPNLEHVIAQLEERLKRNRQASPEGLAGASK